ncbi:Ribosomal protein S18 acetylase RimI [Catalinimonas alkaloidigena]|uniref:Ribosomal protein S18 acetylase RimI n=1 Tax=Catalinimonas alkaloidigena TaxID=1075417 RepID=A0A1G9VQ87_9BACT|nr:GNAT family N-acetyltransferase [Catalinimonas alkaloidigena]SDM74382.1 Ribosomal protein S18 acetylase RimI [Catalinimonas alkaloidigena]
MITIQEATNPEAYRIAATLFQEYAAQLGVDLGFQHFTEELATLERQYARPHGVLFVAYEDARPLGCVGIRRLDDSVCELKRMYLRQETRGRGLGKRLLAHALEAGRSLGYSTMRLDTLPTMQTALALYTRAGFYEIAPYRVNPIVGTRYLEIKL